VSQCLRSSSAIASLHRRRASRTRSASGGISGQKGPTLNSAPMLPRVSPAQRLDQLSRPSRRAAPNSNRLLTGSKTLARIWHSHPLAAEHSRTQREQRPSLSTQFGRCFR
jgi:hypothetical protein